MNDKNRKLEVAKLIADGLTAAQISQKLGITKKTVEKHLEILRAAYMAKNAPHLIAILFRTKIIDVYFFRDKNYHKSIFIILTRFNF